MKGSIEFPFLEEARRLFDPEIVRSAQRNAITRVKNKLRTLISKLARGRYNVAAAKISEALKMKIEDREGIRSAHLEYSGSRFSLINFSARFRKVTTTGRRGKFKGKRIRRSGASAKVTKTSSPYLTPGGFIAAGNGGNVQIFQRIEKNSSNSKLRKMTGPAVAQMVSHESVLDGVDGFLDTEFPKQFESRLNYLLEKAAK